MCFCGMFTEINLNASLNLKVDSPNRFMSLQSRPVCSKRDAEIVSQPARVLYLKHDAAAAHAEHMERRTAPYSSLDCPQERIDFHKTFSALINLHNNPEKKKKEADNSPMQYVRQLSSEQELFQIELSDLIWLELQAYLRGQSINEHDAYLTRLRSASVPKVLQQIMNFKVRLKGDGPLSPVTEAAPYSASDDAAAGDRVSRDSNSSLFATPDGSFVNLSVLGDGQRNIMSDELKCVINQQKQALEQVASLLKSLDDAESLYPTCRALGEKYPVYASSCFQSRLQTLCLWYNITKDLGHKLSLMASVLYVDTVPNIDWPWLDYESPTQRIKNIRDTSNAITPDILQNDVQSKSSMVNSDVIDSSSSEERITSEERLTSDVTCPSASDSDKDKRSSGSEVNSAFSDTGFHTDELSEFEVIHHKHGASDSATVNGQRFSDPEILQACDSVSTSAKVTDGLSDTEQPHNDGLSDDESCHNDGLSDDGHGQNDGLSDDNQHENDGLSEDNEPQNDGLSDDNEHQNDGLSDGDQCQNDGLSDDNEHQNDGLSDGDQCQNDGLSDDNQCQTDGLSDDDYHVCTNGDPSNAKDQVSNSGTDQKVKCKPNISLTIAKPPQCESVSTDPVTPQRLSSQSLAHSTPRCDGRKSSGSGKMSHVRFDVDVSMSEANDSTANLVGLSPHERCSERPAPAQRSVSNVSSITRTDSSYSLDDSRTAIYRRFVDRHLKKMGLRKLMSRLRELLDGTLQRARQALEPPATDGLLAENFSEVKA